MELLYRVKELLSSDTATLIERRVQDFRRTGDSSDLIIFSELSFCVLTANTSADLGIRMQEAIPPEGFAHWEENVLRDALRRSGYRFYNTRSSFIVENRWIIPRLRELLIWADHFELREYLARNLRGIGYKEASHFLRNVGIFDFAILDRHILKILSKYFHVEVPKTLSRKKYLEIEKLYISFSEKVGLQPGVLDLYLWRIDTNTVMK